MKDKTQKIAEELHKALKGLAVQEGRTLQDLTEELLRNGLQSRGIQVDSGIGDTGREEGDGANR